MNFIKDFLGYTFHLGEKISFSVQAVLLVALTFVLATFLLKMILRIITRRLPEQDSAKFTTIFLYIKYFVYVILVTISLDTIGIDITVLIAGSTALFVGLGLGMQTLFQDIVSGIFILIDQSVHVNDIIEIEEKIGKVETINLRTTRAVTIDNKVLIIPNHKFLTSSVFNWTQNGSTTKDKISIGVAYGTDVVLVKKLLLEVASAHPKVLSSPAPMVLFTDFGDNALCFDLVFTTNDSFSSIFIQSDLRFAINSSFKTHQISIPFPQRDVHLYTHK